MKSFNGAKRQDLKHYATSHLEHEKPDTAHIHRARNNMSYNNLYIDASILAENNYKTWKDYGGEDVVISSQKKTQSLLFL